MKSNKLKIAIKGVYDCCGKVERVSIFDKYSVHIIPGVPTRLGYYISTRKK